MNVGGCDGKFVTHIVWGLALAIFPIIESSKPRENIIIFHNDIEFSN